MIPYGQQNIDGNDIQAVVDVLKSDLITQGPILKNFELELIHKCDANYATVLNSATSALHLACKALEVGKGDYVWTVPNTFVASANCALYCQAKVDFVDINPHTFNMCMDILEFKLAKAKIDGKLPKVIIPVHFGGEPCDMKKLHSLKKKYGFYIIEDASHAIGASVQGVSVGACTYSEITVFSFHPVKIITTGEGGAALTNSKIIDEKLKLFRSHGVTRDSSLMLSLIHI